MIEKFFKKSNIFFQKGFGIIEIILILGVGMILFLGFEQYLNLSLKSVEQDKGQTEALYLAKSLLEQARSVRDEAWSNIFSPLVDADGKYYFTNDGLVPVDKWITASGKLTIDSYTVWVKNYSVNRDSTSKDIVSSGGTTDTSTLKITASVSWVSNGATKQIDISEYLTNRE